MHFFLAQRKEKQATFYFREARAAYFAWGAYVKTRQLELKYNPLAGQANRHGAPISLLNSPPSSQQNSMPSPTHEVHAQTSSARTIDLNSVVQACQVLSSEMDFSKLLLNMV
jgi:hypothetical protein